MAGEDPGVGILAFLLDFAQRAVSAVTGVFKGALNTVMDLTKTFMFLSWRRQMMQGQEPDLKHGKQSLKSLRRHEDRGARIVSVEIGDRDAMKALDKELKALKIDYAVTKDGNGEYILHYKEINEKDVLLAQQHAIEQRFGDPNAAHEESAQEVLDETNRQHEQEHESQERADEAHEQQETQEQEQNETAERQQEQEQDRNDDAQEHQQDQEQRESAEQEQAAPTPVPIPDKDIDQRETTLDERPKSANLDLNQAERTPSPAPEYRNAPVPSKPGTEVLTSESLEELKQEAKERARSKNLARKKNHNRDMKHNRNIAKNRERSLDFGR